MECPRLVTVFYRFCLILVFTLSSSTLLAQTDHDSGVWLALFARGDAGCEEDSQLKWWFDGHARFFDDSGGFGQSILRPGLGYALSDSATVWAGYGWINTSPAAGPGFDEHRVWQQITWSKDFDPTRLGLRSRLEQRFLETGSDTGWRFRQLVSLRRPLGCSRTTLVAWDEVFIHLNDTDWGATGGFDQNRLFLGLGFKVDPSSCYRVEVGYLNQFLDRPTTDDLSNHLVAINFYWSP